VNTRFRVGTLDALFHSDYGALLLAKIALVASMLGFAAMNRWVLTPRLGAGDPSAAIALRHNAIAEIVLGALVVALVGLLGITAPAMVPMAGMTH
jgi:putative copper resistance protein D